MSMPLGTSGTIDYVFDGQLWAEWRRFAGADRPVRQPTRVMLEVVIRALGQDGDEIERARSIDPVGAARIDARQA
ncbi:MAG: hypothetical protein Q8O56_01020 [Solirubrobacteraceae bacterium]|nr:hypothetical protein [Solirubrobacteraceae bacterium]